jgi:hypothetical protein
LTGEKLASVEWLFQISGVQAERWLSGLKRTPGKREWAYTPPGVRISLSPPTFLPPHLSAFAVAVLIEWVISAEVLP